MMEFVPLSPQEAAKVRRKLGLPEPRQLTPEERRRIAEAQVQALVPLVRRLWEQMVAEGEAGREKAG